MKKVGIFGGSFNPIHTGHIALAKSLCEKACLDEVWFMVSPMNPFKKTATDLLDDHLRLEMVEKALEHEPQLKACDYEFRLPKPSYTWHTLQAISKDYPENEFTLLIGGDNWAAFDKWYHHDDILAHYPIVVYPRQCTRRRYHRRNSTAQHQQHGNQKAYQRGGKHQGNGAGMHRATGCQKLQAALGIPLSENA